MNSLVNGGLLGGGILIGTLLVRVCKNLSFARKTRNHEFVFWITFFYTGISFFEAYPPYGPGVAGMVFWLTSGYVDASKINLRIAQK